MHWSILGSAASSSNPYKCISVIKTLNVENTTIQMKTLKTPLPKVFPGYAPDVKIIVVIAFVVVVIKIIIGFIITIVVVVVIPLLNPGC